MIPPGVRKGDERRRWPDEVGSFGHPKAADDASGKSTNARCARDHSPEVFGRACDAGDRTASGRCAVHGQGDAKAVVEVRLVLGGG